MALIVMRELQDEALAGVAIIAMGHILFPSERLETSTFSGIVILGEDRAAASSCVPSSSSSS